MYRLLLALPLLALPAHAESLFHIARNKNRNEVHFKVRLDKSCAPRGKAPVYNFWRMLEKGPRVTEPVGTFEQMAYGFDEQKVQGDRVLVKLEALPARTLAVVARPAEKGCEAHAYTQIGGQPARLQRVYVFAVEGFFTPTVKYVDLIGVTDAGEPVTERINAD